MRRLVRSFVRSLWGVLWGVLWRCDTVLSKIDCSISKWETLMYYQSVSLLFSFPEDKWSSLANELKACTFLLCLKGQANSTSENEDSSSASSSFCSSSDSQMHFLLHFFFFLQTLHAWCSACSVTFSSSQQLILLRVTQEQKETQERTPETKGSLKPPHRLDRREDGSNVRESER